MCVSERASPIAPFGGGQEGGGERHGGAIDKMGGGKKWLKRDMPKRWGEGGRGGGGGEGERVGGELNQEENSVEEEKCAPITRGTQVEKNKEVHVHTRWVRRKSCRMVGRLTNSTAGLG